MDFNLHSFLLGIVALGVVELFALSAFMVWVEKKPYGPGWVEKPIVEDK